jgi:hypothetical protein
MCRTYCIKPLKISVRITNSAFYPHIVLILTLYDSHNKPLVSAVFTDWPNGSSVSYELLPLCLEHLLFTDCVIRKYDKQAKHSMRWEM